MALVTRGFELNLVLSDNGGNKSRMQFALNSITFAGATTDTADVIAAVDSVTDAAIITYTLAEVFGEDTVLYGSGEVENVASISARIDANYPKYATVRIPAANIGVFQAATGPLANIVDPADSAVVTFLELYTTAGVALISDGEVLISPSTAGNVVGKRIHRASRKG